MLAQRERDTVLKALGEHKVEFVYRPKSVLIGVVISMLTLIGLCACSTKAVESRIDNFARRVIKQ